MTATVTTVSVFLAVLTVLVIAHELGHFVVARVAGIRVLEFGFGYPPPGAVDHSRTDNLLVEPPASRRVREDARREWGGLKIGFIRSAAETGTGGGSGCRERNEPDAGTNLPDNRAHDW